MISLLLVAHNQFIKPFLEFWGNNINAWGVVCTVFILDALKYLVAALTVNKKCAEIAKMGWPAGAFPFRKGFNKINLLQ